MSSNAATVMRERGEMRRAYLSGFLLALVLTLIPFALVAFPVQWGKPAILTAIAVCAFAQILVHLHYFLHLDLSDGARWNLLSILFTTLILFIMAGGTVWILFNLHAQMMPG